MKKKSTPPKWTPEQEAEFMKDDAPALTPEIFAKAYVNRTGMPMAATARESIHLKVPSDVLEYFRSQGPGYQTRMNEVLAAFVHAAQDAAHKAAAKR